MRSSGWLATFVVCGLIGTLFGYTLTLIYQPGLLPPILRFGGLTTPTTVLLLGTDVVYERKHRYIQANQQSLQGRSDTIMVVRFDPIRNTIAMLSIPRDTTVKIPGYRGTQKINAANALGGPRLATETVASFLSLPINHYLVLNVHGLVEMVDELGGITVEIPKKMKYNDRSAKLHIDLEPGPRLLNGTEAMGFVRFRHDLLGDIGRVQRQELFLKAVQEKFMEPATWAKVPKLLAISQKYISTDLNTAEMMQLVSFGRAVPKKNQHMIMLPGHFSGTGDWAADDVDVQLVVSRLMGRSVPVTARPNITVSLENATSDPNGGRRISRYLTSRGYNVVSWKAKSDIYGAPLQTTRIIAQRGNTEEAELIKQDLSNHGDIVNASVGDIQSGVTVIAGDDLGALGETAPVPQSAPRRRRLHR